MDEPAKPEDFRFLQQRRVAWGEMDALGHVNNTVYFRFFESARIALFEAAGYHTRPEAGMGPILADTQCRFRIPLVYPARIRVGTRILKWGSTSVVMQHAIFTEDGRLAAEGRAVVVWFDYAGGQKTPWPEAVKAALQQAVEAEAPPLA